MYIISRILVAIALGLMVSCSGGQQMLAVTDTTGSPQESISVEDNPIADLVEGYDAAFAALPPQDGSVKELSQALAQVFPELSKTASRPLTFSSPGTFLSPPQLEVNFQTEEVILTLPYQNMGDYDQNGEINIADIASIARYWGQEVTDSLSGASVVDGSMDQVVNLTDLVLIGAFFQSQTVAFIVEGRTDEESEYSRIDRIDFNEAQQSTGPGSRLLFKSSFSPDGKTTFRMVPVDSQGRRGTPTIPVTVNDFVPDATWMNGFVFFETTPGSPVDTSAVQISNAQEYFWDFGSGAIPHLSTEEFPSVTATETLGQHDGTLTVSNFLGSSTGEFFIRVVADQSGQFLSDTAGDESSPHLDFYHPTEVWEGQDFISTLALLPEPDWVMVDQLSFRLTYDASKLAFTGVKTPQGGAQWSSVSWEGMAGDWLVTVDLSPNNYPSDVPVFSFLEIDWVSLSSEGNTSIGFSDESVVVNQNAIRVLVSPDTKPAGEIHIAENQLIGTFDFQVQGEAATINYLSFYTFTVHGINIPSGRLVDENGNTVTTLTIYNGYLRFGDEFTLQPGSNLLSLYLDIASATVGDFLAVAYLHNDVNVGMQASTVGGESLWVIPGQASLNNQDIVP